MHAVRVSSGLWSRAAIAAATICLYATPAAAQADFIRMPGQARSIGIGANGAVWVLGWSGPDGSNYDIYRWTGTQWQKTPGSGVKIAVDPAGNALVVNSIGNMYRYSFAGSPPWVQLPGKGKDIAASANSDLWMIGLSQPAKPDEPIFRWTNEAWEQAPGGAVQIAVAPNGSPWVVNSENELYQRDVAQKKWIEHPLRFRSIAIGPTGAKFAVTNEAAGNGNYKIVQDVGGTAPVWATRSISGVSVAVGPTGEPWVLTAAGEIYRGTAMAPLLIGNDRIIPDQFQISAFPPDPSLPLLILTPPAPPLWGRQIVPFHGGKLVCSGASCGTTKADWVGPYQSDTTCDIGTYSPLFGGTCWACPADDGLGNPWNINLLALESDDGCWRVPYPRFGKATWIKSAWPHECDGSKGEFWGGSIESNGNFVPFSSNCWKCANPEFPRWTVFHFVAGPQACATPVHEGSRPRLVTFNGCPRPDAAAMGLKGEREPDKPFLDIVGGWAAGVAAGGCFSCPVVEENGDILVTERNLNPLTDRNNNSGCEIRFRWTPPVFPEPGLSGLEGVKEVLFERNTFVRPTDINLYLRIVADANGLDDAKTEAYVRAEWAKMEESPYRSETIRSLLYVYLRDIAGKSPDTRTEAEKKLLASFENYIRIRRTFLAQQALNMYDAWKAEDDRQRMTIRRGILGDLFYYGTVPLDFHKTLQRDAALGTAGAGYVGGLLSSIQFYQSMSREVYQLPSNTTTPARLQTYQPRGLPPSGSTAKPTVETATVLKKAELGGLARLRALNIFKAVRFIGGSTIVAQVGALLTSVAIDQFVAIKTARPKLEAALAAADQPVDLASLVNQYNGEDLVLTYWGKSMDAKEEKDDPQLLQMAKAAHIAAQLKQYWW